MSADIADLLAGRLRSLDPVRMSLTDESRFHRGHAGAAEGAHYALEIASPRFAGLSPLARHRMVYEAVGDLRAAGLHALSVKAFAPEELPQEKTS